MRILLLHNSYRQGASGEYTVFASEKALLESRGNAVLVYERSNDDIESFTPWRKLSLLWETSWSKRSYRDIKELIRRERPDVAHFHNTLPLISPSAYYACQEEGVPVVQTLHNYRLFCAAGIMLRSGRACEECLHHGPWRGVRYGCYRGSRVQTAAVAHMVSSHRRARTWTEQVDAYIALTEFSRRKFVQAGVPAEKIFVKPNFLNGDRLGLSAGGAYAIYLGRLTSNKGVRTMLSAWRELPDVPLKIVGDGPLRGELERAAASDGLRQVDFLGHQSWERCMELLQGAGFLVLPSEHHEGFPCVVAEAYGLGKPVLGSRQEPLPELIEDGETGMLFETGCAGDLAEKARRLCQDRDRLANMGTAARRTFDAKYTAERNYQALMQIYQAVISKRAGSRA
jgi:glycosyltransferase involved in cell wall biosynthesis